MAIRSNRAKRAPKQNNTDDRGQARSSSSWLGRARITAGKRLLIVGLLGFFAAGLTGCRLSSQVCRGINSDCIDDFMIGYRNRAMAEKAWHCRTPCIPNRQYIKEFKDGFVAGYNDVANGGNGCTPAIAPSSFWGWQYQSASGQAAIDAWFQGYPYGVKAAEQDGVGHWQAIRLNHYQNPGSLSATGLAPSVDSGPTGPAVTNPFYPQQEFVPEPVPETLDEFQLQPGDADPIQLDPGDFEQIDPPTEADSVFDSLFPPVAVGDASGSASSADAVLAERAGISAPEGDEDNSLPFSFE